MSHVEQGRCHLCPAAWAQAWHRRATSPSVFQQWIYELLVFAFQKEKASGTCGSVLFPQLPRPCSELPCAGQPGPGAPRARELLLAPAEPNRQAAAC